MSLPPGAGSVILTAKLPFLPRRRATHSAGHAEYHRGRPGLELYGTEGTANLLGDDWDPRGLEIWRKAEGCWREYEPIEGTWLWADGLAEMVRALHQGRPPLGDNAHDLHLLEIIEQARHSAAEKASFPIRSGFDRLDLQTAAPAVRADRHHLHDHTRPADEQ